MNARMPGCSVTAGDGTGSPLTAVATVSATGAVRVPHLSRLGGGCEAISDVATVIAPSTAAAVRLSEDHFT